MVGQLTRGRATRGSAALWLALALAALLALAVRPAAAQSPDGDCDPAGEVACLPLPEESEAEETAELGDDPSRAVSSAAAPAIAPAPPPRPCVITPVSAETRIAAPAPPLPSNCGSREVLATVNRANALYAAALRTLDPNELPRAWSGGALTQVRDLVADLRARGRYAVPRLLAIELVSYRGVGTSATVVTREHWLYEERDRWSDVTLYQADQWAENVYALQRGPSGWTVVRNDVREVSGPSAPPASAPATVRTDRERYAPGGQITATVTNTGSESITGGGGYRCGFVRLELLTPEGWRQAPGGAEVCPAIAILLQPGQEYVERLFAPSRLGVYRFTVPVNAGGQNWTAVSPTFEVR